MIVLQILIVFVHMCVIPYFIGWLVVPKSGTVLKTVAGIMVSYAVYEVIMLSMQMAGKGFRFVTYSYVTVSAVLALLGLFFWCREKWGSGFSFPEIKKPDRYMILAFVMIAIQMAAVLFLATPDEDDAFYSGLSSMSLAYDYLLEKNAYVGLMDKAINPRYILSGLPIYQASLSLLSGGLHHLVITHDLFPLFYIPLAYALYYEIGKKFLQNEGLAHVSSKFLFYFALLHMIGNYYIYSPENFLVTRLWQGKALFVAFGVPALWYFGEKALSTSCGKEKAPLYRTAAYWFVVMCGLLSVAFMGETGLYLGTFMVVCLTLASCVVYRSLKGIPWAVASCLPMGALFIYLISA